MKNKDIIKLSDVLKTLPDIFLNIPFLLKGLIMSKMTKRDRPIGLGKMIETTSNKFPSNIAIYHEENKISYKTLNELSNQLAHYFLTLGYKKGDTACILMDNRIELLVFVTALSKIGVICGMINTSHQGDTLIHSCNLIKPALAIVGEEHREVYMQSQDGIDLKLNAVNFVESYQFNEQGIALADSQDNIFLKASDYSIENLEESKSIFYEDPAFYIFTSGTTGLPKAAVFTHGRLYRVSGGFGLACMKNTDSDIMYVPLPFFHSTAMVICWSSALIAGSSIVMRNKFSVSNFWKDCKKYNVTCFGYIGELCRYLIDQPPSEGDNDHSVNKIVGNGLSPLLWDEFKDRFNINKVHEFYGASEGNIAFMNLFNLNRTLGFSPLPHKMVKYDDSGQPIRNEKDCLIEVAKGEPGLLISEITQKNPFDGYTQSSKTQKTIIKDAFSKGDAWFNTGDVMKSLGFGHVQFVDRMGDTYRWKGENVSTAEVENMLHDFSDISNCIAYGVAIENTNGKAGMLAINTISDNFNTAAFLDFAKQKLPSYAVPIFLRLSSEPLSTTDTFKHIKTTLKQDSYMQNINDVYILLPNENDYTKLTEEILLELKAGSYRY